MIQLQVPAVTYLTRYFQVKSRNHNEAKNLKKKKKEEEIPTPITSTRPANLF